MPKNKGYGNKSSKSKSMGSKSMTTPRTKRPAPAMNPSLKSNK